MKCNRFLFFFKSSRAATNYTERWKKITNSFISLCWPILLKASLERKINWIKNDLLPFFFNRILFHIIHLFSNLVPFVVSSLKIWCWLASFRIATWNFATLVSRDTSATALTYGRSWARLITWVSAYMPYSLISLIVKFFHSCIFDTWAK